jgi:hypothetical protein
MGLSQTSQRRDAGTVISASTLSLEALDATTVLSWRPYPPKPAFPPVEQQPNHLGEERFPFWR